MEKISSYETLFIVDAQQGDDGIRLWLRNSPV